MSRRMPGQGLLEFLAGEVAFKAVAFAATRALKRDDLHEVQHLLAMFVFGNSNHEHGPCRLPADFDGVCAEFSAEGKRGRA